MRTRKEYIKEHRKMWRWLTETGKYREDYFKEEMPDVEVKDDCWACEYASEVSEFHNDLPPCKTCLFIWNKEQCDEDGAYFDKWAFASTKKTMKKYAKIIAELPVRRLSKEIKETLKKNGAEHLM